MRYLWLACLLALSPAWSAQLDGDVTFTPAELEAMKGDPGEDGQDGTTISFSDSTCTAEINGQTVSWEGCTTDSQPPPIDPCDDNPSLPQCQPPGTGGLRYVFSPRAPVGAPFTAVCSDGRVDTQPASANMTLCGESYSPQLTSGALIFADPPTIPVAGPDDWVILRAGRYDTTTNCDGRQVVFCGQNGSRYNNSGMTIIGDVTGPMPVLAEDYDCGSGSGQVDLTLSYVELDTSKIVCNRQGHRTNLRFTNIYCHDSPTGNGGACLGVGNVDKLRVLGFRTRNTGQSGDTGHVLYFEGRGISSDAEFGWLDMDGHIGRRGLQVYGHTEGEELSDIYVHDSVSANIREGFLFSHTDGQSGPRADRRWIDSIRFEDNVCIDTVVAFIGTNLNGGQDWNADGNQCDIDSEMGGDPSTWLKVTNNMGQVTGDVRQ